MKFEFISNPTDELNEFTQNKNNLPKRATKGSAGYDFKSPITITVDANDTALIPTGIKAQVNDGYVLKIYPRSSYGFKYGVVLANTVGIIDSDYYNNESNEGHIFVKLRNLSNKPLTVNAGDNFCQGIFEKYYLTDDDDVTDDRKGGIGSTTR